MNSLYAVSPSNSAGSSLRGNSAGRFNDKIPSGYKSGQLQKFTPEALNLYQQLFSYLSPNSPTSQLARGEESAFADYEKPAYRAYEQGLSSLGNRYAQLAPGAQSASRGSGFANRTNQYAIDFAERLASNRQQLQRQALGDLFNMSNLLFNNQPYERFLTEKPEKKALGGWGGAAGGILGGIGGFALGGPVGAAAGASIGSNAFSGL